MTKKKTRTKDRDPIDPIYDQGPVRAPIIKDLPQSKWDNFYILEEDHTITPVPIEAWVHHSRARFARMEDQAGDDHWRVASDQVGPWWVSTVFLGMDHRHFGEGPPILFETMIFVGSHSPRRLAWWWKLSRFILRLFHRWPDLDQMMWRHCTWQDAHDFHHQLTAILRTSKVWRVYDLTEKI